MVFQVEVDFSGFPFIARLGPGAQIRRRRDFWRGMKLTPDGYMARTRIVKGIAEDSCHGRLISLLESGYNLAALAASVEAHVRTLKEPPIH